MFGASLELAVWILELFIACGLVRYQIGVDDEFLSLLSLGATLFARWMRQICSAEVARTGGASASSHAAGFAS
jgi:hypothetical protein